jgi:biopolymer transport protein ExbD
MSVNFSTQKKPLTAFSQAGLADIVLLLLIFFLLTSSFIPQFGIQVTLPQAAASATMQDQTLSVAITNKGQYYVEQRLVPRDNLLEAIAEIQGTRTALDIRADKDATIEQLATVADIGKALNLRIMIATERGLLRPR